MAAAVALLAACGGDYGLDRLDGPTATEISTRFAKLTDAKLRVDAGTSSSWTRLFEEHRVVSRSQAP